VSLRKKKVARRDLFRFESYDLQHHQWVIRTSDNRHLAVDESGSLFVESGCITTTFLRFVKPEHLQSCFDGLVCKMCLCATSVNGNTSFFLSSDLKTILELPLEHCATYQSFGMYLDGSNQSKHIRTFSLLPAIAHSNISRSLKLLCPKQYDPLGTLRHDNCNVTQSVVTK
jgi:hypothetical protein